MICLAFDTTAKAVTAALCDGRKLLSAYFAELPGVHTTETLLPSITHMLTDAGLTFDDIGLVAVTVGPGSFTGASARQRQRGWFSGAVLPAPPSVPYGRWPPICSIGREFFLPQWTPVGISFTTPFSQFLTGF